MADLIQLAIVRQILVDERVRIQNVEVLSDDWYTLKKTTFQYRRKDGIWQTQSRETYDRGNGATILLYNREHKTVILTRQFRFPAYVNHHHGMLVEACAGLLDERDPEAAIRHETEEETGFRIQGVKRVMEAFMSPGSVTERLYFFVAEYDDDARTHEGGGVRSEGEEIDVLEIHFQEAMRMIESGEIMDGKTIMLLQYACIHHLLD